MEQAAIPTAAGSQTKAPHQAPSVESLQPAFPNLEILELIGQGGMGFVFKARQLKLNRLVALKILPETLAKDPAFAERFAREGQLLAQLDHPNVVTVHDFGQAGGFFYLLMEYVDGVNLRQAMRASRFTPEQALSIVPSICAALQYAHDEGVLHRDIKPENILLDVKGRVKIADFGIAKLIRGQAGGETETLEGKTDAPAGRDLTQTGATLGTPTYMAPEQINTPTEVDHRADIYSLGVVFYEMLTGELPTGAFAPPSSKTPLDGRVDEVVARALEKRRERRFDSASEFGTRLEGISATVKAERQPAHDIPAAAIIRPIPLGTGARTVLFIGFLGLIAVNLKQLLPAMDSMGYAMFTYLWQDGLPNPTRGVFTVIGLCGVVWLALKIWSRREWLVGPPQNAAPSDSWINVPHLGVAWKALVACLALQAMWIILGHLTSMADLLSSQQYWGLLSYSVEGLLAPMTYPPPPLPERELLSYSVEGLLVPILLIIFFVRRELRRSDLVAPAPAPPWAVRVMFLFLGFSLATSVNFPWADGVHTVSHHPFVATVAFALLTMSRVWRGIALAILIQLFFWRVWGLATLLIVGNEWIQMWPPDVRDARLRTWVIIDIATILCLSAGLGALLRPRMRQAFGLRATDRATPAKPRSQNIAEPAGLPHES